MTVAVTQDLLSTMLLALKIKLIRLLKSTLPEPGQPSAQLSKLIPLIACKMAKHTISRLYRTVSDLYHSIKVSRPQCQSPSVIHTLPWSVS